MLNEWLKIWDVHI